MIRNPEISIISIVVVGKFNPIIFQPSWLALKSIIGEIEANGADVEIIHREIVRFKLEWAEIEITSDKFNIKSSKEAYFEPVRDLICSIFTILNETPIDAVGINHSMHFQLRNESEFLNFGNFISPLENWKGAFKDPKISNIDLIQNKRNDSFDGMYRLKVQTSDLIKANGVMINLNDHVEFTSKSTKDLISYLNNNWEVSAVFNQEILDNLWTKFKK
jgi:hypothetical protein